MKKMEEFREHVEKALQDGAVLVCYLDGLGYRMYEMACTQYDLKMKRHFRIEPVWTVEPPVTNAAFATMLTGVSPAAHGIFTHADRKLMMPTMLEAYGEDSVLLEGDMRILETVNAPILHIGDDVYGVDERIFQDTFRAIKKNIPFIFSHFHEIDDLAHQYGPYHAAVMEQIHKTDRMLDILAQHFYGSIFLISDHGLYEHEGKGIHGKITSVSSPEKRKEEEMMALWGERLRRNPGTEKNFFTQEHIRIKNHYDMRRKWPAAGRIIGIPKEGWMQPQEILCGKDRYFGYSLKELLKEYSGYRYVEAESEDGCCVACSEAEINRDCVWLVQSGNDWRLLVLPEEHRRRWCKRIKHLRLMEDLF